MKRNNAKILCVFMITGLLITTLNSIQASEPSEPHLGNAMWIEPSFISLGGRPIGFKFNVTVWLNITEIPPPYDYIAGWQFVIAYDKTYLNATRAGYTAGGKSDFFRDITTMPTTPTKGSLNATHNYAMHSECWQSGSMRGPGYGSLSWLEFEIIYIPAEFCEGRLSFEMTGVRRCKVLAVDVDGKPLPTSGELTFTPYHGIYVFGGHDVAVEKLVIFKDVVRQGDPLLINVTVENQGSFTETFNVTAYANTTIIAAFENITLTSRDSTTLTFTWNTSDMAFGNYMVWAEASVVPEEIDTADNTLIDGTILIEPSLHDVAITGVRVDRNSAYAQENVSIYVDAWNVGYFPETFNVTAYADENSTIIGDEITIGTRSLSLQSKGFTTLALTWNTTGVSPGNYTVSAVASNVSQEADPTNNLYVNGKIEIFTSIPCYEINITSPTYVELNPAIFQFNWTMRALEFSLGNMTIDSTGYEGLLRILGSTNGTVRLRVDQPHLEFAEYYLPQNGFLKIPLWLLFEPGTYSGTYELQLTVCGTHRLKITINVVSIWVCQNGCYSVAGGTATFNWTVTGGSLVYLEAQPNLPPGWSFTVEPPIGTLFETPHQIIVNITAAPDAKEGDIGSVTLRAYKNGTNILIWQYTFFSSVDNKPPTIEAIQPPTLTFTGDLMFNATVKDASGIESVQLCYSVNNGPGNNQTMRWNSGDTFNSTSYTLTIPHVPDNSTIKYYIVATDWLRNQIQSDVQTIIVKYDLTITEVKTSETVVGQGFATQISVTIANEGTIPNTLLKVSLYANTTLIHTQTIPYLTNGTATTLTFYWKTSGFVKGNYTISAYAWPVPSETDTADNIYIDGWVVISIYCDVNGDRIVDLSDILDTALAFGSTPGHPRWNPKCDLDDNGIVDISDILEVALHFGEIAP